MSLFATFPVAPQVVPYVAIKYKYSHSKFAFSINSLTILGRVQLYVGVINPMLSSLKLNLFSLMQSTTEIVFLSVFY